MRTSSQVSQKMQRNKKQKTKVPSLAQSINHSFYPPLFKAYRALAITAYFTS